MSKRNFFRIALTIWLGLAVGPALAGDWTLTGSLHTARGGHTATLLPNGKVLVAGGSDASFPMASAELYDPATGTWSETGSLNIARNGHTATLLMSGKVLVTGGGVVDVPAELYDPATGTWSYTGSAFSRNEHTATLLTAAGATEGTVLVTGGQYVPSPFYTEIYDPQLKSWSNWGTLQDYRRNHTATLLTPNSYTNYVLVVGGDGADDITDPLASAEIFDPSAEESTVVGSLSTARTYHTATLVPHWGVMVVGGLTQDTSSLCGEFKVTDSTEIYDSEESEWLPDGPLNTARYHHTATLLQNGDEVLVAGGLTGCPPIDATASAELYDTWYGSWSNTGPLNEERYYHTATLLQNGQVLVVGGGVLDEYGIFTATRSAELYTPGETPGWSPGRGRKQGWQNHSHPPGILKKGQLPAGLQSPEMKFSGAQCLVTAR